MLFSSRTSRITLRKVRLVAFALVFLEAWVFLEVLVFLVVLVFLEVLVFLGVLAL